MEDQKKEIDKGAAILMNTSLCEVEVAERKKYRRKQYMKRKN